jgi:hypothetical protein
MQRDRLPYILLPLAALIAVLPLILHGCSCGHDFDFHILNWLEAARQFAHGNLHPHWAYTPAWNAGEPRFVFYPPLSWTIGAILGLIFPWTWTPILYTWLALTASGIALHRLARDFTTPTAALLAATFYVVNPYMLFTAYERTAYAELLAAAWIPLLLHAILREKITIPRIAIPVALLWLTNAPAAVMSCYALALLATIRLFQSLRTTEVTNSNSSAIRKLVIQKPAIHKPVISTGATHSLIVSRAVEKPASPNPLPSHPTTTSPQQTLLQQAFNTAAGTALGLGLAAFYILPAAYERRYVQIAMAILPGMRIRDNFLFHHTDDILHDQVLHTASTIALTLIAVTAAALIIAFTQIKSSSQLKLSPQQNELAEQTSSQPSPSQEQIGVAEQTSSQPKAAPLAAAVERPLYFANATAAHHSIVLLSTLAILTIAITLLLTPLSASLWNHAPELLFLQFPWRLLAILAAVLSLAAALALRPLKLKPITTATVVIAIAAALTYPAYTVFHQSCDDEDTVQAREALFHSNQGTDPTDEYTPTTADNDSLPHANPAFWLSPDPNAKAPANAAPSPAPTHLTLNSPAPQTLILNLRDYPSWRVTLNGVRITTNQQDERDDGLIVIPIPAGPSTIDIAYAHTLDQLLGNIISVISLALLLTLRRRRPL